MPREEVQADPAALVELQPQASPLAEAGVEAQADRKRGPGGVPFLVEEVAPGVVRVLFEVQGVEAPRAAIHKLTLVARGTIVPC